ncbi:MAG: hypothetical protein K2N55_09370, partial [Lachnospiraceae bacterium]|nr:hypothetical protein [Lachnospiraceae bacterium]
YETACRLFDELWNSSPIRLLGVRSSKLTDVSEPVQLSLFDLPSGGAFPSSPDAVTIKKSTPVSPSKEKLAALDKTLDSIRQKYGDTAVMRGSFLTDSYEK